MSTKYDLNATISYWRDLSPELAVFRVTPDCGEVGTFEAGQYAEIAIPTEEQLRAIAAGEPPGRIIRRSYSIASNPLTQDHLEFYVVHVPGGVITPQLWERKAGSRIWLGPKIKGKFTLQDLPREKDYLMISTGTGLSPFVSMVRQYRGNPPWRRAVILHGARLESDLGYREELEQLAASERNVTYIPSLTREPQDSQWRGLRGRIPELLNQGIYEQHVGTPLDPDHTQVLLCGNPEMIDSVQLLLEGKGFKAHSKKDPGQIHFERFW